MYGLFSKVTKEYNESTDLYTFRGSFGQGLINYLTKLVSRSRLEIIFKNRNIASGILEIYGFFLPELEALFRRLLEFPGTYNLNMYNIKTVVDMIEDIKKSHEVKRESIDYSKIKNHMRYDIMDIQKIAFERYSEVKSHFAYKGFLLDADTGTGKTSMSVSLAKGVGADIIIVIAPKNIVTDMWLNAIANNPDGSESRELVLKKPEAVWTPIADIPKHPLVSNEYKDQSFIIVSYETMDKIYNILHMIKNKKIAVIIDEWHSFADKDSKRSTLLTTLIKDINSEDNILMSGTPVKESPTELGLMLKLLDRRFLPHIEKRFYDLYRNPGEFLTGILPERYKVYSVKISKKDLKLPPLVTEYIPIVMPNGNEFTLDAISVKLNSYIKQRVKELEENMEYYKTVYQDLYLVAKERLKKDIPLDDFIKYEKDFEYIQIYYKKRTLNMYPDLIKRVNAFEAKLMKVLEGQDKRRFAEAKAIVKYLLLKVRGDALANVIMKERIRCHAEMTKYNDYNNIAMSTLKKVLVFSGYIDVCDSAYASIVKGKHKAVRMYGEYLVDFSANLRNFKNMDNIKFAVATYKSLGTGIPVTEANIVLIGDTPFRMYIYDQAIARVWRLGQESPVTIYINKLETNGVKNINDRNVDIITFFAEEVKKITGYEYALTLDAPDEISITSEGFKYISTVEHAKYYASFMLKGMCEYSPIEILTSKSDNELMTIKTLQMFT